MWGDLSITHQPKRQKMLDIRLFFNGRAVNVMITKHAKEEKKNNVSLPDSVSHEELMVLRVVI